VICFVWIRIIVQGVTWADKMYVLLHMFWVLWLNFCEFCVDNSNMQGTRNAEDSIIIIIIIIIMSCDVLGIVPVLYRSR
jgi:hypothetical protein